MICGNNGRMGQIVSKLLKHYPEFEVVAGIDRSPTKCANEYPVYQKPSDYHGEVDLIIDFSHSSLLESLINYAKGTTCKLVIATTGYSEEQLILIHEASKEIPILYSSNMSLGINILKHILKQYVRALNYNFDIEIIEKHHNQKLDSPSGTAFLLANTINDALNNEKKLLFGRRGDHLREEDQVAIHAVRGGSIVGDHTVMFAGSDEVIELKHSALSKDLFATGAIKAAQFMINKEAGYYTMDDIFKVYNH